MNILVVGLGSMGKRRIRLLKKMYQQYHIYGVDLNAQRCAFVKKEYEMETFPTMEEAVSQRKFECAFEVVDIHRPLLWVELIMYNHNCMV